MRKQSEALPFPLYHGTSSLFLDGIAKHGLGGKNPVVDWQLLEFARQIAPLVERHLAPLEQYMVKAASFGRMADQFSGAMNFQHGDTYLTPAKSTAVRYATSKSYGSELLSYTLDFLRALVDRNVPTVADCLYREYPHIFEKLDISSAPILLRIDNVPASALSSEFGGDASALIDEISAAYADDAADAEFRCQQSNFRLGTSIPAHELKIWLIGVTKWNPFQPEYQLYPISVG